MKKCALLMVLGLLSTSVLAEEIVVSMTDLNTGKNVGKMHITENQYGTVFKPELAGLPPGMHGFHIHENPSCASKIVKEKKVRGAGAGGHFDPYKTGKHGYPWIDTNHLGDLPALSVDKNGRASYPVLAPRLTLKDLKGRAVMIHAGGDTYSDQPHALGGGGARLICGVITSQ